MAVILKQIRLVRSKGSEEVVAIFDGEATYCSVQPELALKLGAPEALSEPMEFGTAKQGGKGHSHGTGHLELLLGRLSFLGRIHAHSGPL